MVAYSFQSRFVAPIVRGTKRQTIRGDRKRHARRGEEVQLYIGMRTLGCRLIGRAACLDVMPIRIRLEGVPLVEFADRSYTSGPEGGLDAFARSDGFEDWRDMREFWAVQHPGVSSFSGWLILWDGFAAAKP